VNQHNKFSGSLPAHGYMWHMLYRSSEWGAFRKIFPVLLVLILFRVFPVMARDNIRVVNYSLEHGLSQISVNSIIQDSEGFIWVGTQDGLNKFDGYGFTIYRHQPSDPRSLSNSSIESVIETRDGNIWVGTQGGLNRFDRNTGTFRVYQHEPGNPHTISSNSIQYLFEDRAGFIWIKTEEGLDAYDPESDAFSHYNHYNDVFNYVSGTNYFSIYEDRNDRLWIGSKDGLFHFDRETGEFTRYFNDPALRGSISSNKIKSIFETSSGHFLVGTDNGLNLFDRETGTSRTFFVDAGHDGPSRLNVINKIYEDSSGAVWIGTDAGLFTFSPEHGRFSSLRGRAASPPFIDLEVSAILEDRSMNLWIGTLGGLYMVDSKSKFRTYRIHDYIPGSPPSARFIASIYPASPDELWLGTWGGGLFILNRRTGEVKQYSSNSPNLSDRISNDFVHVIFSDSKGRIILGTRDGMDLFRGHQQGFIPWCPSAGMDDCSLFNSNRVYCIYEDSRDVTWIGTRYGLHSLKGSKITSYYHNPLDSTSISSNQVNDVLECRDGFIWVATVDGLNRFDRETGNFFHYRKDPEKGRFSLSNNHLTSLLEDSNGNLWIGSVAGLNRFFKKTGSFIVFSEMEGLPNNLIYSLLDDDEGCIWISTNHGIARFDPSSYELSSYDVADGLQNYEFNLGARFKCKTGEFFFGGVDGVNSFFPDSLLLNKTIPALAITSFEVITPAGNRRTILGNKKQILLQPHENSFSVEFAALDFTRPAKNQYAYKLEGLEDNWIYAGTRRIANFSKIPSGNYVLHIKGSNNDGVWNEEGVSLRIIIITPWWRTIYAYVFYAIFLLLLIYLVILFSTRSLRNANQILREKELASTEISRQREELILKNRNITDSINYARRIQLAMMPTSKHFRRLFPESFVFYKPKDIVSGDFYWVNKRNDKVFFAVIDCTGHGVPGAFMSIIGYELLRNIINIKGIERPSDILNQLNKDFSGIFNAEGETDISFRDGMDIGFCVIDRKLSLLEFAGAFSPMYLIRNKSITEIKGNRFSVGLMEDLIDEQFENHVIKLEKNDMIYLFSDGYPDQFGGEEGKKFKYRRFRHLLLNIHTRPADEQEKLLDQSIIQWMNGHEQVDDILILGVRPGLGPG
jgi:ligand-binding sensor domain-containing protein/serine phosphatase RsbU (regulator of sigma subunit)